MSNWNEIDLAVNILKKNFTLMIVHQYIHAQTIK